MNRIRGGDPEELRNWEIVKRMFGGLIPEQIADVRSNLRDFALELFDAKEGFQRKLLVAAQMPAATTTLRGGTKSPFHELFEVDGHEIDLSWNEDELLIGQLLVSEEEEFAGGACVLYGDEAPRQVEIESLGEFEIPGVRAGSYELALETEQKLLLVPELVFKVG